MKAITVWQPQAQFMIETFNGFPPKKRYETRKWSLPVEYRNQPLALHAGKTHKIVNDVAGHVAKLEPALAVEWVSFLGSWERFKLFPFGAVIAIVEITDVILMQPWFIRQQSDMERALGDWIEGYYAWQIEVIEVLNPPVYISGKQKLWEWTP